MTWIEAKDKPPFVQCCTTREAEQEWEWCVVVHGPRCVMCIAHMRYGYARAVVMMLCYDAMMLCYPSVMFVMYNVRDGYTVIMLVCKTKEKR